MIRILTGMLLLCCAAFAQNGKIPTCDAPEFHQFDFWLGDWQVLSEDHVVGHSRIESQLNGCLIVENWYGVDGDVGKSMNFYDRRRNVWRQVYVGVHWNIDYTGSLVSNSMQFESKQARLTFTANADGTVRQHKQRIVGGVAGESIYDFTYQRSNTLTDALFSPSRDIISRCHTASSRQFDFWAGNWDVFAQRGRAGTNTIQPVAGGCILLENWSGLGGMDGKSFNFVDSVTGEWRQVWVSAGGILDLHGKWEGTHLRLSGENKGANGAALQQRITWTPRLDGSVRQHWEQSQDGGATWSTAFDGLYLRRTSV